jgi:hypothetical protein
MRPSTTDVSDEIPNAPASLAERRRPKFPRTPSGDDLERLTKLGAMFLATLYVTGLLTTNTYLYQLGLSDFSLLRARYIYTGTITLLPIFVSTIAPVSGVYLLWLTIFQLEPHKLVSSTLLLLASFFTLLVFILLPILLFLPFLDWDVDGQYAVLAIDLGSGDPGLTRRGAQLNKLELSIRELIAGIELYIYAALLGAMGAFIIFLFGTEWETRMMRTVLLFFVAIFFVGYWGVYLSKFTESIFPVIPEQFGGGTPREARLLFAKKEIQGVKELGIKIPKGKSRSSTVKLLHDGEQLYVLQLPNGRVIGINKALVQGIEISK